MLGGFGNAKEADNDIQALCDQVKSSVQEKAGKTYSTFKAVSYISQVVAGMNYKIKVNVGGSDFIHIKVFRGLGTSPSVELTELEEGKSENDGL